MYNKMDFITTPYGEEMRKLLFYGTPLLFLSYLLTENGGLLD